ncbi:MAG: hypothetical protein AAF708_21610 [Deinococcota bacterium]
MAKGFWINPQKIARVMMIGSIGCIILTIALYVKSGRSLSESMVFVGWMMLFGWPLSILVIGLLLLAFYILKAVGEGPQKEPFAPFCWLVSAFFNLGGFLYFFFPPITYIIRGRVTISEMIYFISGNTIDIAITLMVLWMLFAFVISMAAFRGESPVEVAG